MPTYDNIDDEDELHKIVSTLYCVYTIYIFRGLYFVHWEGGVQAIIYSELP